MADFKNRRRYENLNRLSTEQLEELLHTAPFLSDSQETSEYYDAIEEVILERETETPTGRLSEIDSAWAEFRQQYADPEGRGQRLYPDEERSDMRTNAERGRTRSIHGIFRKAGLAAAVIAAMLACMVAAQASGLDVFGALANWTNETFHFRYEETRSVPETPQAQSENEDYLAIQAEVDQMGITVPVVPTWFPADYALQDIQIDDNGTEQLIDCLFENGDAQLAFLTISKFRDQNGVGNTVFEKDDSPVIEYISNNRRFYIMSNLENKNAVWSSGNLCVSICGLFDEDVLKEIIDSIGE